MKKAIFAIITLAIVMVLAIPAFAGSPVNLDWEGFNSESMKVETFEENALNGATILTANGLVTYRAIDSSVPHANVDYVGLHYLHESNKTNDNIDAYWDAEYELAHEGWVLVLNQNGKLYFGGLENVYGVAIKGDANDGFQLVETSKHSVEWASKICLGANDMVLEENLVVLTQADWTTPLTNEEGRYVYAFVIGEEWVAPIVVEETPLVQEPDTVEHIPGKTTYIQDPDTVEHIPGKTTYIQDPDTVEHIPGKITYIQDPDTVEHIPGNTTYIQDPDTVEHIPGNTTYIQDPDTVEHIPGNTTYIQDPDTVEHIPGKITYIQDPDVVIHSDYNPQEDVDFDEFTDDAFESPLEPSAPTYSDYNKTEAVDFDDFDDDKSSNSIETYEAKSEFSNSIETYEASESGNSTETYSATESVSEEALEPSAPTYSDYNEVDDVDFDDFGD